MKRISYIAMLATAAFCQLSSCMNQAPNSGDRNQSSPAARTLDMWSLKLPNDFSVKSVPAKNRVVEVDFDNNEVRISATMHINISFDGSEVMGSTSLSFVRTRLHSAIQVPTVNPHAFPAPFMEMRPLQTHPNLEMKEENKQERIDNQKKTGSDSELFGTPKKKEEESKRPKTPENLKKIENSNSHTEEVNKKKTKQIDKIDCESFLNKYSKPTQPLDDYAKELIVGVFDSGISTATAILEKLLNLPSATKKEKEYIKVRGKVEHFIYYSINKWKAKHKKGEVQKGKEEESKPTKKPKDLKGIADLNSDTEELDQKKTSKTGKISCESFLNKYSKPKQPLDDYAKELITDLYDSGTTSATTILEKLLNPSDDTKMGVKFKKVRGKVATFIYNSIYEWKATHKKGEVQKGKEEESKSTKTHKTLNEIVDLNSDTEEPDQKETKQTDKIDCESF